MHAIEIMASIYNYIAHTGTQTTVYSSTVRSTKSGLEAGLFMERGVRTKPHTRGYYRVWILQAVDITGCELDSFGLAWRDLHEAMLSELSSKSQKPVSRATR